MGSRYFYLIMRLAMKIWLTRRFRLDVQLPEGGLPKPPYLVVANHVNYWDPFIVGVALPHRISFVASDSNFRNTILRSLLRLIGAISKTKARTDMESVRTMRNLVRSNAVVGIFPEGQRTWDGVTRDLMPGSEKLVRLLKVPVVATVLRGAYFSTPRWSEFLRRGRLVVENRLLFSAEEAKTLPLDEISTRMKNALFHDENEWQAATGIRYYSRRSAEYVEQAFFCCPKCGVFGEIRSNGHTISCGACDAQVRVGSDGRLTGTRSLSSGTFPVPTFRSWNLYQLAAVRNRVSDALSHPSNPVLAWVPRANLFRGNGSKPLLHIGCGRVLLTKRELVVELENAPYVFSVPRITSYHIQFSQDLEFYFQKTLFVIRPQSKRASTYWLEQTLRVLQETNRSDIL